jgi:2-keto-4-pentenoate hydratase/2-oxohepta-3-ene-1,7-dioic acid hydratase in catechol pathway
VKLVCVGLNYRDHAKELGMAIPAEPVLFLKPETALIGPEEAIVYPAMSRRVDYEAELAVVIGRKVRDVTAAEALRCVAGYACFNDVTARDLQERDIQWTRAKSFDTFAPLGKEVGRGIDPGDLLVECYVNGARRQSSSTRNLIFPVPELVSFISRVMTLHPGDVIATGTPPGVGPLRPGDVVEVVIEGVGRLRNPVVLAPGAPGPLA